MNHHAQNPSKIRIFSKNRAGAPFIGNLFIRITMLKILRIFSENRAENYFYNNHRDQNPSK